MNDAKYISIKHLTETEPNNRPSQSNRVSGSVIPTDRKPANSSSNTISYTPSERYASTTPNKTINTNSIDTIKYTPSKSTKTDTKTKPNTYPYSSSIDSISFTPSEQPKRSVPTTKPVSTITTKPIRLNNLPDDLIAKYKLTDYNFVTNIREAKLGAHVRYFKKEGSDLDERYRSGGFLKKRDPHDRFVILTSGPNDWTVTVDDTDFFVKKTIGRPRKPGVRRKIPLKQIQIQTIQQQSETIIKQMEEIDKLREERARLVKLLRSR